MRLSQRAQMIRDLTLACVWEHLDSMNDFAVYDDKEPDYPTDGQLLYPDDPEEAELYDQNFNQENELAELLTWVSETRYLVPRFKAPHASPFNLNDMLRECRKDFRQAMRTTPEGFEALRDLIKDHPSFISTSNNPPPPLEQQLAITLERLGSNGNGASVGRFSRNYKVSRGQVIKCTRRVIKAIIDRGGHYPAWPSADRRKGISSVLKQDGFPGCVGFVDGTTIPLYQRPGQDGEVFFDRKHDYSINVQVICDCDRRITYLYGGWPGSCCDSTVYGKSDLAGNPDKYFSPGEYLVADSAYVASETVVPSYKGPAAQIDRNREFNWCVAKARVRNEHCIGILKGRWASLQGLRLALDKKEHMNHILDWIKCCAILHNMLANLGNAWDDLTEPITEGNNRDNAGMDDFEAPVDLSAQERGRSKRDKVRDWAVSYNWKSGGLPIVDPRI